MAYEAWNAEIEYSPGVWTDVTARVDGSFTVTDGDTPESSTDTGGFTLPLGNHDQAFTPGNALSSLALRAGLRVRIRETVNGQLFHRGFGYTAYPEIQAWTQSTAAEPRAQLLVLPVVDRAAWIAQGRTFISTLGEHIIHHGGPALVSYWPLGESEGPEAYPAFGSPWTLTQTKRVSASGSDPNVGPGSIAYGSRGIPPADDLSSIEFTPSASEGPSPTYVQSVMLTGARPTPLTVAAGQALTVVAWTRPGELLTGATSYSVVEVATGDPAFGGYEYVSIYTQSDMFVAQVSTSNWQGAILGPPAPRDHSVPVAVRVSYDPPEFEFWIRDEVYTDPLTVITPASRSFSLFNVAERYAGAVGHAQVYLGDPSAWTHQDFLAQREMGLVGLERQSTGDRIRTVLEYAGVDPSELGRIDDGVSLMQVARLAGRNPMDIVGEAVSTEQGELHVDGAGQFVFADRRTLYNV